MVKLPASPASTLHGELSRFILEKLGNALVAYAPGSAQLE